MHSFGKIKGAPWYENGIFLTFISLVVGSLIAYYFFIKGPSQESQAEILAKQDETLKQVGITTNLLLRGSGNSKPTLEQQINMSAQRAMARHWEPPEFPQGAQGVALIIGGTVGEFYDTGRLASRVPLVLMPGGSIVLPYLTNNRVYIKAQLPFGGEESTVKMSDEWPIQLPSGWDRNFDSKSLEIVDDKTNPVFQVRYDSPIKIEVYGIFVNEVGAISMAFDGVQSAGPGIAVKSIPKVKSWFKYPSSDYLGTLAE